MHVGARFVYFVRLLGGVDCPLGSPLYFVFNRSVTSKLLLMIVWKSFCYRGKRASKSHAAHPLFYVTVFKINTDRLQKKSTLSCFRQYETTVMKIVAHKTKFNPLVALWATCSLNCHFLNNQFKCDFIVTKLYILCLVELFVEMIKDQNKDLKQTKIFIRVQCWQCRMF